MPVAMGAQVRVTGGKPGRLADRPGCCPCRDRNRPGFGVARIKVDDSLSQLFRSDTPEFKQYEEVARRFPSSEFDVQRVAPLPRVVYRRRSRRRFDIARSRGGYGGEHR
jgi:hypothetical protein